MLQYRRGLQTHRAADERKAFATANKAAQAVQKFIFAAFNVIMQKE